MSDFTDSLLVWYQKNKRILPWRDQPDPYFTWVSEIMLQQTRVEAVKAYFLRFTAALPDIKALAECPEDRLLKLWEGLGYYSRVRNMQKAARILVSDYHSRLPASFEELLKLPGIGSYTAAAIASISYGIPVPVVDGNVLRVMTRLSEDSSDVSKDSVKKKIYDQLLPLLPKDSPGDFNQAIMDLGAMICVPNGPAKCEECPVLSFCLAGKNHSSHLYPVKAVKKPRKVEKRTVFLLRKDRYVFLGKRPARGLLAGLYEFPNTLGFLSPEEALDYCRQLGFHPVEIREAPDSSHIFSHIEWHMTGYEVIVSSSDTGDGFLGVNLQELMTTFAVPSAFHTYVKYFKEFTIK